LTLNQAVKILTKTGGTGLTTGTHYYAKTVPAENQMTLSLTQNGATVDITVDATAGTAAPSWEWQRFYEPHGVNGGDPGFVDAENEDFHIASDASAVIGAALQSNAIFTEDYDGVTRGVTWDMGAFEFVSGVPVPDAPTGLSVAAVSANRINLSWTDASSTETGFHVFRSLETGANFGLIDTVGAGIQTYANTGLAASTQYFYKVTAYNSAGDSAYTSEANATTLDPPFTPPAVHRRAGKRVIFLRR
jgi:hypothetical protein